DYESLRFLQLHIHRHNGKKIKLSEVGVRRRFYPWKKVPTIKTSDQNLQKLLQACINTVYNNSQETMVDGMGRERQQYSGDIGHQVHAIHPIFNAPEFFLRYLVTFSQGMTVDGFFLDTWPAYDRLNRLAQRQLGLTHWGPLLDHGIGFNFDCYYHFLYSGSLEGMEEVFPRLIRFFDYLRSLVTEENLLPVENIGIPTVWMDTDAYQLQRHKQCAFNLYAIAMLRAAFAPLCEQMGYKDIAKDAIAFSNTLHASTVKKFWDASTELFINNLPWIAEEEKKRMDDRTLATAYLYDLFPNGKSEKAVEAMANKVPEMGKSYPPNANWWLWAIAKAGKVEVILEDFSTRWIQMDSVLQNNTMQEAWKVKPDSRSQWSHAAIAPLYVTYMNLAGINPIEPGFEKYEIFPQLASLNTLELTYATVKGDIYFKVEGGKGKRRLTLKLPETGDGELVLPKLEKVKLPEISTNEKSGFRRYRLPKGETIQLSLKVV
ncbi:MAG: alpha-L-rhamnosidase C-terminal domain-containing protein, partial [Bacteroidota bacterium]